LCATAMLLHDGLADREPEPGAAWLGGEERIEQLRELAARDAAAGIDHADLLQLEQPWDGALAPHAVRVRGAAAGAARHAPPSHAAQLVAQRSAPFHGLQ